MVTDAEISMIAAQLMAQKRQWRIGGELVTPTFEQIRSLIETCVETIREDEGSISIETGGLLIKRSEEMIDIYVHTAELEYDE